MKHPKKALLFWICLLYCIAFLTTNSTISQAANIYGIILDGSQSPAAPFPGNPVTGQDLITVFAVSGDPCSYFSTKGSTVADPTTGQYMISDLAPGKYYITTNNQSNAINEWWAGSGSVISCSLAEAVEIGSVSDSIGPKNLVLDENTRGSIFGTIYHSDGTTPITVPNGDVLGVALFCGYKFEPTFLGMVTTNPVNGTFMLTNLPNTYYLLNTKNVDNTHYACEWWTSSGSTYNMSKSSYVPVSGHGSVTGIDFQIDNGYTIQGTVYDEDGVTPMGNVPVMAYYGNKCQKQNILRTRGYINGAFSDESDGSYTIDNLPPNIDLYVRTQRPGCGDEVWLAAGSSYDCADAEPIVLSSSNPVQNNIDFQLASKGNGRSKIIHFNDNTSVADFPGKGIYKYSKYWTKLTDWNSDGQMINWNEKVVADFGEGRGLYCFGTDSAWTKLTECSPDGKIMSWGSKLVMDTGSFGDLNDCGGISYFNGSEWTQISLWGGAKNIIEWGENLVVDFGGTRGLFYCDAGNQWYKLTDWCDVRHLMAWNGNLLVDFGPDIGLFIYNGGTWVPLTRWSAKKLITWGNKLIADFGRDVNGNARGMYYYFDGSWHGMTQWSAYGKIRIWGEDPVIDFAGSRGIYMFTGSNWVPITKWDTAVQMESWDDQLVVDFGVNRGIHLYDGNQWTSTTSWDTTRRIMPGMDLVVIFGPGRGMFEYDKNTTGWTKLTDWLPETTYTKLNTETWNAFIDDGAGTAINWKLEKYSDGLTIDGAWYYSYLREDDVFSPFTDSDDFTINSHHISFTGTGTATFYWWFCGFTSRFIVDVNGLTDNGTANGYYDIEFASRYWWDKKGLWSATRSSGSGITE